MAFNDSHRNALCRYCLPQGCNILKLKWINGMAEPTLIILAKIETAEEERSFFMDIALVIVNQNGKIDFDLRLR